MKRIAATILAAAVSVATVYYAAETVRPDVAAQDDTPVSDGDKIGTMGTAIIAVPLEKATESPETHASPDPVPAPLPEPYRAMAPVRLTAPPLSLTRSEPPPATGRQRSRPSSPVSSATPTPTPCGVMHVQVDLNRPSDGAEPGTQDQYEIEWASGVGTYLWRDARDAVISVPIWPDGRCRYVPVRMRRIDSRTGKAMEAWREYREVIEGGLR